MSEVIVITSGKGGVGKTTCAANIGTGLAALGQKVVLLDTDIGLRNLDVVMGLEDKIVYNLVDVIEGTCRIKQALIRDKRYPLLYLMPSPQNREKNEVDPSQMIKLISFLKLQFDYVIIDCPAGIDQGFQLAVAAAEHAIVVTTPEISAVRDADRVIGILKKKKLIRTELIINKIRPAMVKRGDMMNISDLEELLDIPLLGVIEDDEAVIVAAGQGDALAGTRTRAGEAYMNICFRLSGEELPIEEDYPYSFFHRLSEKIHRA